MKLLLVARLADVYPDSSQVRLLHLERASDSDVWYYARAHGFVIVTKDSDIVDLALLRGTPPKIVWLRVGNATSKTVEELLRSNKPAIEELMADSSPETARVRAKVRSPTYRVAAFRGHVLMPKIE